MQPGFSNIKLDEDKERQREGERAVTRMHERDAELAMDRTARAETAAVRAQEERGTKEKRHDAAVAVDRAAARRELDAAEDKLRRLQGQELHLRDRTTREPKFGRRDVSEQESRLEENRTQLKEIQEEIAVVKDKIARNKRDLGIRE